MHLKWLLIACQCLLTLFSLMPEIAVAGEERVDLELVLAVDASGSVDDRELGLQLRGIAAAFRDPAVVRAIEEGPLGRIAVSLALWAESNHGKDATPWFLIDSAASAETFAKRVERQTRTVAGGTGIGAAMFFGVKLITENGIDGLRRVIDISGDGRETTFREWAVPPDQARHRVRRFGVTVNALAILNDDPGLEEYYRAEVMTGPGAFTLAVANYEDFAAAMRRKLIREIRARPQVSSKSRR